MTVLSILWVSMLFHLGMLSVVNPPEPVPEKEGYGFQSPRPNQLKFAPSFGVGVPRAFQLGGELKWKDSWGFGVHYGFFPERTFASTQLSMHSVEGVGRWFVHGQRFFLGAAMGSQSLVAKKSQEILGLNVKLQGEIQTTYLVPTVGWHSEMRSGFFYGFELGWQMAVAVNTEIKVEGANDLVTATEQYNDLKKSVEDAGNSVGRIGLPVAMVRMGWYF